MTQRPDELTNIAEPLLYGPFVTEPHPWGNT